METGTSTSKGTVQKAISFASIKDKFESRTLLEKILIPTVALLSVSLIAVIASFPVQLTYRAEENELVCKTKTCKLLGASIRSSLDLNADPCSDFYQYSCGNWLENVDIPHDLVEYGLLDLLRNGVVKKVNDLLWNVNFSSSIYAARNACTFYITCMDADKIENDGVKPLMEFFKDIGGWPVAQKHWDASGYDASRAVAEVQLRTGYGVVMWLTPITDPRNTSNNIMSISPSVLFFPSDVLLNPKSNQSRKELENYKKLFVKIADLVGAPRDETFLSSQFQDIVDFATFLLKARTYTAVKYMEDPVRVKVSELCAETPEFDWLQYLQRVTNSTLTQLGDKAVVSPNDTVLIYNFPYIKRISRVLSNTTYSRQIANYLGWHVITLHMKHLPRKFYEAYLDYIKDSGFPPPVEQRWEMCTKAAISSFSDVLSLMYIEEYFPEVLKNEVMKLVVDIKFQFETTLKSNLWMDLDTKLSALNKLIAMKVNIGHPDWLFDEKIVERNYVKQNMPNMTDSAFRNRLALSTHETMEQIAKLRQKNTNDVWMMLPVTVNAGYNRNMNGITFPAAFLQAPLYESGVPKFYNFATIGSVIGHEITHGFDNEVHFQVGKGMHLVITLTGGALSLRRNSSTNLNVL